MTHLKTTLISLLILTFAVANSFAEDANELLKKIDEKLTPESYEAYRKLINEEPTIVEKRVLR